MANYTYTYEILSVDDSAGVMEVLYKSDGKDDYIASARIPFDGEDIDDVIDSYSPINKWIWEDSKRQSLSAGITGSRAERFYDGYIPEPIKYTLEDLKSDKVTKIKSWRNEKIKSGVWVGEKPIEGDHRTLNTLRGVLSDMKLGKYSSINFKLANNSFTDLSESDVSSAIDLIMQNMIDAYNTESILLSEVENALTIEEVDAINISTTIPVAYV